jgi:3',5'-cyclic-AMP phosphodiesterase
MNKKNIARREFIRRSGGGAAFLALLSSGAYAQSAASASPLLPLGSGLANVTKGDFTVDTWFRTTDPGRHILLGNFSTDIKAILNLELHSDNHVRVVIQAPDGKSTDLNVSADPLGINTRDGEWHHLAATRSEGWMNIYLDGRKAGWKQDGTATHSRTAVNAAVSDRTIKLKPESLRFAADLGKPDDVRDPDQVEFGVISDLHLGVINWKWPGTGYVEQGFVEQFLEEMSADKADFVIQLGDFCKKSDGGQKLMDIWNSFDGPVHNVLGNHERDGGSSFAEVAKWWGMPNRYYSFDIGRMRGIILDANEPGGGGGGYAAYVGPEQRDWLKRQLAESDRPVIIFVHQPIEDGIRNGDELRAVIEAAENERPGTVMAVISGHAHKDYAVTINSIPYIQINSASYHWYPRFGPVRHAEPVWGRVTIDFDKGELRIKGRDGGWLDTTPWELGATDGEFTLAGGNLYIGSDTRMDSTRLVGDLDNPRFWQGGLWDDDIAALAAGVPAGKLKLKDKQLMAEYRFEKSDGSKLRAGADLKGAIDDSADFEGGPFNGDAGSGGRAKLIADAPKALRKGRQSKLALSFNI